MKNRTINPEGLTRLMDKVGPVLSWFQDIIRTQMNSSTNSIGDRFQRKFSQLVRLMVIYSSNSSKGKKLLPNFVAIDEGEDGDIAVDS